LKKDIGRSRAFGSKKSDEQKIKINLTAFCILKLFRRLKIYEILIDDTTAGSAQVKRLVNPDHFSYEE
jgi:hypothetical protein